MLITEPSLALSKFLAAMVTFFDQESSPMFFARVTFFLESANNVQSMRAAARLPTANRFIRFIRHMSFLTKDFPPVKFSTIIIAHFAGKTILAA